MRELKFRAWHNGKMLIHSPVMSVHAFNITPDGKVFYRDEPGYVNGKSHNSTIMQFTGLKDKNGKEIYEGDIVSYDQSFDPFNEVLTIGIVRFGHGTYDSGFYNFQGFYIEEQGQSVETDGTANVLMHEEPLCEVIGNIYENPEKLK